MKEPVQLTPRRAPRAARAAAGRPATRAAGPAAAGRPGKVPGGKALARLNLFLIERGLSPEPTAPPPPVVPGARAAPAGGPTAPAAPEAGPPAAGLVAGFLRVRRLTAAAAQPQPTWQPLGPYYMPHGQTYGEGPGSRPPVAGRVAAVAIDPGNDQHILCGSAGGGVWETTDGGRTWAVRTDDQPSISIGALAFDPSDPARVYAGTGEGNTARSRTGNVRAAGLLVSNNGGTAWAVQPGGPFLGVSFYDLSVDLTDGNRILAATSDGLFETTNRGVNWHRRRPGITWSLSRHPPVPTNPAAGQEVLAACEDGVFRSANGGTTWAPVALPGLPAGAGAARVAVAHAPSNGSVAYVFAAGPGQVPDLVANDGSNMPRPRLWRRAVLGGAFTAAAPPADLQTGQAWYDWCLAVAPNNPDVVYVGGINVHRGLRGPTGTWAWEAVSAKPDPGQSIHPDQHVFAFSPADANVVYVGNDGGLYRSPDAGVRWEALNKGLSITEIEFLAQHPVYDAWLLAGTQDNGTIRYEGQQTWYHVRDGDGGDCGVNADHPATCYHSFYGPYIERSTTGGGWGSWDGVSPDAMNAEFDDQSIFYPPLEVNGSLVVRGAWQVWLSRNRGDNWVAVPLPPEAGHPSALVAPTADRVYAGTTQGHVYRLDWDAGQWTATALGTPAAGYVSDFLTDPNRPDDLWCSVNVGGDGGMYHSDDGGQTWAPAGSGLPAQIAVHAIEIDSTPQGFTLYAATDVGVFRTTDAGASWAPFGMGLPNVLVRDLLLHPVARLLRAGTQARGVWEVAVDGPAAPAGQAYLRDHAADTGRQQPTPNDVPNPFEPGANLFWWQSPDIKIDASPFHAADLDELDFDAYSDDRSKVDKGIEFSAGLKDNRPVRGQTVRVYVQAHNRGGAAAQNVAVRVFFGPAGLSWPDLPAGFWAGFPNNQVPADSPWQPVADHRRIARIESGRSAILGFNWDVPMTAGAAVGLLAVVAAPGDPAPQALNIADLVRNSRTCALRNLAVINPPPDTGPATHALAVDVWPAAGPASLEFDRGGLALVRGVVLPESLARAAREAGWKPVKLTRADADYLGQLADARPELRTRLKAGTAYRPAAKSPALALAGLRGKAAQPVVLLFNPKAKRGVGSVVLRGRDEEPRGGLTIVNLGGEG